MQSCSYVLYLPTRLISACVAIAAFTSYMHLWHASKAVIQHFRPLQLPEGGIGKAAATSGQAKAEASSKILPYALWGPTRHIKSKRSVAFWLALSCLLIVCTSYLLSVLVLTAQVLLEALLPYGGHWHCLHHACAQSITIVCFICGSITM